MKTEMSEENEVKLKKYLEEKGMLKDSYWNKLSKTEEDDRIRQTRLYSSGYPDEYRRFYNFWVSKLKVQIQESSMSDWLKMKFYRMRHFEKIKYENKNVYKAVRPRFIFVGDIILENYENPIVYSSKDDQTFMVFRRKGIYLLQEYLERQSMYLQWAQVWYYGCMEGRSFKYGNCHDVEENLASFKKWRDEQDLNKFNYTEEDYEKRYFSRLASKAIDDTKIGGGL